jgi:glycosyltransferase involved in cell wall biosynthesis
VLYLDSTALSAEVIAATSLSRQRIVLRQSYLECCEHPSALARMLYRSRRVSCIFCDISPAQAGDDKLAAAVQEKLVILPAAHSTDWYATDADLQAYGIPEGAFTVASVATEAGGAALRWLIACAQWVPMDLPVHFLLLAPKTDHEALRRMIRKMPFTQRFHLDSNVAAAPGILAAASVAVIPNWWSDLQRQACRQSLAAGVPVFAADSLLIRSVVRPEVNGELFGSDDPEALGRSIYALFEDNKRRATLCAGARRSARQWTSVHQQSLDLRTALERAVAEAV